MADQHAPLRDAVARHRAGDIAGALTGYQGILQHQPDHAPARHGEGLALEALGRLTDALAALRRAAAAPPASALHQFNLARIEARCGHPDQAEAAYRTSVAIKPDFADSWNNLGLLLEADHRQEDAIGALQQAVRVAPDHGVARINLARLLCAQRRRGEAEAVLAPVLTLENAPAEAHFLAGTLHEAEQRFAEAITCYKSALARDPGFDKARNNIGTSRLGLHDYDGARDTFLTLFREHRGVADNDPGTFCAQDWEGSGSVIQTCRERLENLALQLRYLCTEGKLGPSWEDAAQRIDAAIADHDVRGLDPALPHAMSGPAIDAMAGLHERAIRFEDIDLDDGTAIGASNDYRTIEQGYLASPTSVTVIDDFLSPEALFEIRRFCLESTVFFGHNATGYVTSYMADGFACSLLYRIAAELQQAMPRVLGGRQLHNMWVYRHRSEGAGVDAHTDDASVTFNFWITDDEACLDPEHGGLIVYAKEQPLDWDWNDINLRKNAPDVKTRIDGFLADANPITLKHRSNRAVLFHSNLFHKSDRFRFREGIENRRTNITLLFGERGA